MFKYILLFSLAVVAIQAISLPKKCEKNDDCESDECCADVIFFGKRCIKHTKKGMICIPKMEKQEGDYYKYVCPCEAGTECRVKEDFLFKIPKCRDPKSEPEENDKK